MFTSEPNQSPYINELKHEFKIPVSRLILASSLKDSFVFSNKRFNLTVSSRMVPNHLSFFVEADFDIAPTERFETNLNLGLFNYVGREYIEIPLRLEFHSEKKSIGVPFFIPLDDIYHETVKGRKEQMFSRLSSEKNPGKFVSSNLEKFFTLKEKYIRDGSIYVRARLFDTTKPRYNNPTVPEMLEYIENMPEKLPLGVGNQGATCYLNSMVQTLYHVESFKDVIEDANIDPNAWGMSRRPVVLELRRLFKWLDRGFCAADTRGLTSSFGWSGEVNVQHDVQEFFTVLMGKLQEHYMNVAKAKLDELVEPSFQEIENIVRNNVFSSPVDDLFEGSFCSYLQCCDPDVPFFSANLDKFRSVSVPVKGCSSLKDSLRAISKPEVLDGENQYDTEDYGLQDVYKGQLFHKLPGVLMFHLQRIAYDWRADTITKDRSELKFDEEIDMKPFVLSRKNGRIIELCERHDVRKKLNKLDEVSQHDHRFSKEYFIENGYPDRNPDYSDVKTFSGEPPIVNKCTKYKLAAVIVHYGDVDSGHYYCYCSPLNDPNGQWMRFNDSRVTPVSRYEAMECNFGGNNTCGPRGEAYMLAYIRKDLLEAKGAEEEVYTPGDPIATTIDEVDHYRMMDFMYNKKTTPSFNVQVMQHPEGDYTRGLPPKKVVQSFKRFGDMTISDALTVDKQNLMLKSIYDNWLASYELLTTVAGDPQQFESMKPLSELKIENIAHHSIVKEGDEVEPTEILTKDLVLYGTKPLAIVQQSNSLESCAKLAEMQNRLANDFDELRFVPSSIEASQDPRVHQWRSPMRSVAGNIRLMSTTVLNPECSSFTELVPIKKFMDQVSFVGYIAVNVNIPIKQQISQSKHVSDGITVFVEGGPSIDDDYMHVPFKNTIYVITAYPSQYIQEIEHRNSHVSLELHDYAEHTKVLGDIRIPRTDNYEQLSSRVAEIVNVPSDQVRMYPHFAINNGPSTHPLSHEKEITVKKWWWTSTAMVPTSVDELFPPRKSMENKPVILYVRASDIRISDQSQFINQRFIIVTDSLTNKDLKPAERHRMMIPVLDYAYEIKKEFHGNVAIESVVEAIKHEYELPGTFTAYSSYIGGKLLKKQLDPSLKLVGVGNDLYQPIVLINKSERPNMDNFIWTEFSFCRMVLSDRGLAVGHIGHPFFCWVPRDYDVLNFKLFLAAHFNVTTALFENCRFAKLSRSTYQKESCWIDQESKPITSVYNGKPNQMIGVVVSFENLFQHNAESLVIY
ncbi:hypothetical protein PCE1_001896 [Barthelona sp. PCE]